MTQASPVRDERWILRLFNAGSHLLERFGRHKQGFVESEPRLHETAIRKVGFDDFGAPDYREGLRVLLEAYDREAHLTPFGRMLVDGLLLGVLENRLRAQRFWKENPQIPKQEIRRPLFIMGLPRTGTTALHHLMGQDPAIQVLEYWLAASPQPRPPRPTWEQQAEFKSAARDLRMMYWLDPSLKAMHLMTPDGAEECRHLLQQTFTDDTFDCNATIPSYSAWFEKCDMSATYRQHRNLLKLIGSKTPDKRWLLKYPVHMRHLGKVFEAYPDACIIQTHRDPGKVLPSICSLVAGWRAIYEGEVDRRAIAKWQLELWASGMEHAMEVRKQHDPAQFLDLDFREILSDPVAAVKRVYDHFGLEMTPQAEQNLRAHKQENPRGKHGEHRYQAQDYGLTESAMSDRYAGYIEHFGVERETSR